MLACARNTRASPIVLVLKMILVKFWKVKWSLFFMKMERFQVIEQNIKFFHVNAYTRNIRAIPIVLVLKMILAKFWESEVVFIFN